MRAGSSRHPLPLTRAAAALAVSSALQRLGLPSSDYLERAGLSTDWLESDPEGRIPVRSLYRLLELGGRDVDGFGALVTEIPIESFGQFGRRVRRALTVRGALAECVASGPSFGGSLHTLSLQPDRPTGDVWLLRSGALPYEAGVAQSELLVLRFVTQIVRSAAGSGWKPKALRFGSRGEAARALEVVSAFQGVPAETGAACGGVLVARETLGLSLLPSALPSNHDPSRWPEPQPDDEIAPALRELLVSLVRANQPATIGRAAEMTDLHPRSLQRMLAREGTSYRLVSDQARYLVARELIQRDVERPLTQIAFDVGYSELAAFTRAFHRWAGMAPSALRDANR